MEEAKLFMTYYIARPYFRAKKNHICIYFTPFYSALGSRREGSELMQIHKLEILQTSNIQDRCLERNASIRRGQGSK